MAYARMLFPDVYRSYQKHTTGNNIGKAEPSTFEDLVSEQMAKGSNSEVQRVMQLYGSAAPRHCALAKRADEVEDQCAKRVENIWYEHPECSRTEALRKARLLNPHLFKALQSS
jgi:hypothetical protein